MHSSSAAAGDGTTPEPDEPRILAAHDPPPGWAGDPAEVTLLLAQDRDRIAGALNDVVINRIFSAGLTLETALGLLDGHRGAAGKVREALGELELAIQDVRNVVFDHRHLGRYEHLMIRPGKRLSRQGTKVPAHPHHVRRLPALAPV